LALEARISDKPDGDSIMTTDEQVAASPTIPTYNFHKADDYRTIYVNWVQTSLTPFDVSLIIGHAHATGVDTTGVNIFDVEQKARITFHPAEAKIVAGMLAQSVENYEKQFGEVSVDQIKHTIVPKVRTDEKTEGD
jgi:hypothetical protein